MKKNLFCSLLFVSFISTLHFGCFGHSQSDPQNLDQPQPANAEHTTVAVVITRASDWSSGAHSLLSNSKPRIAHNDLLPTISDLAVSAHKSFFYRFERFNSNNVSKFSMDSPATPIWQFSTNDPSTLQSNPYGMVFASDTKAYLLRYGSNKMWIVNPSANNEAEFKIGEIDLSLYDDGDGSPEMASGIIVGNKLYIALQRLDMNNFGTPSNPSYIAVFDTTTDTEIETGQGENGLKGIKLFVRNPYGKIKYNQGYIYIAGADNLFGGNTYGGIQRINANTYLPDPNIVEQGKNITAVEVVSSTKAYFIGYQGYGNNVLKSFNPSTGIIGAANIANIGDTGDRSLFDMILDKDGLLWLADSSSTKPGVAGIYIIDPSTDTLQEGPVFTDLDPVEIAFCEK